MSIGSKPADDKLVPNCCRSLRMQDSSLEIQGMIRGWVVGGLLLVSMRNDWQLDFCCHTWEVGMDRVQLELGIECVKET